MKTIDKIITKVNCQYGAPMGRPNIGVNKPYNTKMFDLGNILNKSKIFDCAVPMIDGCYDKGGAYWGIGNQLRVRYTKDLTYIEFYRIN